MDPMGKFKCLDPSSVGHVDAACRQTANTHLLSVTGTIQGESNLDPLSEKCKIQPKQTNKQTNKQTKKQTKKQTNNEIMCLKIILITYMCFKSRVAPKKDFWPNTWIYPEDSPNVVVPKTRISH